MNYWLAGSALYDRNHIEFTPADAQPLLEMKRTFMKSMATIVKRAMSQRSEFDTGVGNLHNLHSILESATFVTMVEDDWS